MKVHARHACKHGIVMLHAYTLSPIWSCAQVGVGPHACTHTCACVHMHTHCHHFGVVHRWVLGHMHACMHTCMCVHTCACVHTCLWWQSSSMPMLLLAAQLLHRHSPDGMSCCTVLHCVLYCTALYCTVLFIVSYCNTVLYCTVLRIALYCIFHTHTQGHQAREPATV